MKYVGLVAPISVLEKMTSNSLLESRSGRARNRAMRRKDRCHGKVILVEACAVKDESCVRPRDRGDDSVDRTGVRDATVIGG